MGDRRQSLPDDGIPEETLRGRDGIGQRGRMHARRGVGASRGDRILESSNNNKVLHSSMTPGSVMRSTSSRQSTSMRGDKDANTLPLGIYWREGQRVV